MKYKLKALKRGPAPDSMRPDIRPASDLVPGSRSECIEAGDDDEAAKVGMDRQAHLGNEYIVSVTVVRDGTSITVYPKASDA